VGPLCASDPSSWPPGFTSYPTLDGH